MNRAWTLGERIRPRGTREPGRIPGANQSGSALVVTMIFAVIMLISALAIMELGAQDAALAVRDIKASQAFYNAEAGVERGEAWLLAQSAMPTAQTYPFGDDPDSFGDGLYHVEVTPDLAGDRTIYTIRSYATVAGRSRALEVDVTPTAFTDFLYYVNRDIGPGTPGYFRSGEIVDGPVHINDELAVWGTPTFMDEVESSFNTILFHNDWNPISLGSLSNSPYDEPVFEEGCRLGVPEMEWLDVSDFNILKNYAEMNLNGGHTIVFGRDAGSGPMLGYVSTQKVGQSTWTDVLISSFNGVIYVNGDANVSGIVDGQVTVCSNGSIDVVDDLIYADSDANGPRPGCDDLVGLVGASKVEVMETTPNYNDCVLHAHLLAVNNQATLVERYGYGSPRGTLTIYGGLAQDKWGPVGTGYYDWEGKFNLLTGYERDFHYDWRLRTMLPPGYDQIIFAGSSMSRLSWREITPVDLAQG